MTNNQKSEANMTSDITVVLDRSGSMAAVQADTIGGFNTFLKEQQDAPGAAVLSLVQFDDVDPQEIVYNAQPVTDVQPLTAAVFRPRGNTPLLDALGKAIVRTGERLMALAEGQRPEKVIFVVITDGQENASHEYTRAQVFEMITHQRERYAWEILFLGANQDAVAEAAHYGIPSAMAATYSGTGHGTKNAFAAASSNVRSARVGASASFTRAQRSNLKQSK